ncbi:hypothetical protein [Allomuricauda sp. d1]|uniref:hypothetical protein n=1 Tax=Allomuricauda sp. d1 TaxID=3136725 RepID=UPI0031D8B56C
MEHKAKIERRMERKMEHYVSSAFKVFFMVVIVVLLILLAGYVVMQLWNWLMPDLFGLVTIGYWQALGLLLLAKFFFGFGNGGPGKRSGKRKSKQRFRSSEKCGSLRRDFSEWKLYDEFWEKEGEQAFQEYVNKKKEEDEKGENNPE